MTPGFINYYVMIYSGYGHIIKKFSYTPNEFYLYCLVYP